MTDDTDHEGFMREALAEAASALQRGDRPIGCVIVHDGRVVGRGSNHEFTCRSRFEHAEVRALRSCAEYIYEHCEECILYTTVEPCVMCLGSIVMANIRHVVFAALDPDRGGTDMRENVAYVRRSIHTYTGGVMAEESGRLLAEFEAGRK